MLLVVKLGLVLKTVEVGSEVPKAPDLVVALVNIKLALYPKLV